MKLDASKSYVLWFSGGLDSTLLLAKLRDQPIDFAIYTFRQNWTKAQAKRVDDLIKKWNLKVFSYPRMTSTYIGDGKELAIVNEIAIGNGVVPFVQDVVEGSRCILDLDTKVSGEPFKFDVHIFGSKRVDRHWSLTDFVPGERWTQNGVEFWAPLYDYTTSAVQRELRSRGLDDSDADEQADTGNLSICHNCIKGSGKIHCPKEGRFIDSVVWDRQANLNTFRATYGNAV